MPDRKTLAGRISKALASPPNVTIRAISRKVAHRIAARRQRILDTNVSTYLKNSEAPGELKRWASSPPVEVLATRRAPLRSLARNTADHRFDLLGSGLVRVVHGMTAGGLWGITYPACPPIEVDGDGHWLVPVVGHANADEAARIWRLIEQPYVPIDWQIDFKSGYRWSERTWFRDVDFGAARGADIKVPWELARMQHLPELALADCAGCAQEFRNQVLDFIAANPPRFGVNWVTAMDVAIRATNLLLAYDLFRASGTRFDEGFEVVFRRSILEHGRHVFQNLEWSERRGNHYLSDIAGLLFVAGYLPTCDETEEWWRLARRELLSEIENQFNEDGSNFEASASYHRLSAEAACWALALLVRIDGLDVVPNGVRARLAGMADFVVAITKPDRRVPQVGDNDSGRFLTFGPVAGGALNDDLDHRSLVGAINGLLKRPDLAVFAQGAELETALMAGLAAGASFDASPTRHVDAIGDSRGFHEAETWIANRDRAAIRWRISLPAGATLGLARAALPSFGLWVMKGPRLYIAMRCGTLAKRAPTGHAHNDQLSLELQVDGMDWIADPGTYVYTPLPERRNEYRSMHAHFGPRFDGSEPAALDAGLFELPDSGVAECTYFGPLGFAGRYTAADGRRVVARIKLEEDVLDVVWAAEGGRLLGTGSDPTAWREYLTTVPFSPGYGRQAQL